LESIRRSLYGFINKATLISVPEESYYDLRGEEKETNLKEIAYYRIGRNSFAFLKGDVSEKIAENWRSQLDVYRFRRWKTQRDLLTYLKAGFQERLDTEVMFGGQRGSIKSFIHSQARCVVRFLFREAEYVPFSLGW